MIRNEQGCVCAPENEGTASLNACEDCFARLQMFTEDETLIASLVAY
jgi:hypothetical protein